MRQVGSEAKDVGCASTNSLRQGCVEWLVGKSVEKPDKDYHVLKNNPGDGQAWLGTEYSRILVAAMIHLFRSDRPDQVRGVPDITSALPLFAQRRRFTLAVLSAA